MVMTRRPPTRGCRKTPPQWPGCSSPRGPSPRSRRGRWRGAPRADVFGADNRAGTRALVGHLVEQHGRTRLFAIAGPPEAPDAQERRSALTDALAEYPGTTLA